MDFFQYANVAQMFVNTDTWWVPILVGGLCFAIVFVFQSVGLFIIAGHEGYKNRWMAFVPFLNTYYIGVCGQKNRVFKSVDTKILSLCAAIVEAILVVGYIVYFVAWYLLLDYIVPSESIFNDYILKDNIPVNLVWAGWCFEFLDYVLSVPSLAYLALQIFVLSAFYQTFASSRYMLFTITSILFPVQGIIIFILRNNKGMNYREYLRMEQERQYRMYQQYRQQNFDNNPYNQNPYSRGNYSQNPYENDYNASGNYDNRNNSGTTDDPFSEFGGGSNNGGSSGGNDPFDS